MKRNLSLFKKCPQCGTNKVKFFLLEENPQNTMIMSIFSFIPLIPLYCLPLSGLYSKLFLCTVRRNRSLQKRKAGVKPRLYLTPAVCS